MLLRPPAPPPPPGWIELGALFAIHRGQATGANAVWIAGPQAAGLPPTLLKPTVTRARELIDAGGVLSGEHGIGLAKTPFFRLQHSPAQVRAMQAVKRALDPRGILNPGKMFEVFEVWKHPRLDVKLPWDH